MRHRVVITGAGVASNVGDTRAELHGALCAGRSGLHPLDEFELSGLERPLVGSLRNFVPEAYLGERNLRPLNRAAQLLTSAACLALRDGGWTPQAIEQQEVGLVVGTMFCSVHTISEFDRRALVEGPTRASALDFANTVINAAAGQAAIWNKLRGVNSTICAGITSGLQAIAYAADLVREGHASAVLAGGVEEFCYEALYGFFRAGLTCSGEGAGGSRPVPFDARRNGIALAEGAALLVLEDAQFAAARGATVLAEIKGHGSSFDFTSRRRDDEAVNAQSVSCVAEAISRALDDAALSASRIDAVSVSANGSVLEDRLEADGLKRVFNGQTARLPVAAVKSMLGEALGASGALQTVAMVESLGDGRLPGIQGLAEMEPEFPLVAASSECRKVVIDNALITAVGFDGHCCALVIGRHQDQSSEPIRRRKESVHSEVGPDESPQPINGSPELAPRYSKQGYSATQIDERRSWLEHKTASRLPRIAAFSIEGEAMRGNVENAIGAVQVPLGIAGPLLINGQHARGEFYVPLATTEGALVRSYERGMLAITRAGGATTRVAVDENRACPVFSFDDVAQASDFARDLPSFFAELKTVTDSTTRHGRLLRVECRPIGRDVVVDFCFHTADAHGMNMIVKATDAACRWLVSQRLAKRYYVLSGGSSEKRASGSLFFRNKGKYVTAGVKLPKRIAQWFLHVSPNQLHDLWQHTMLAQVQAHTAGYNGHYANGLTAFFIATGQDVANVVNSAVGITHFDVTSDGDLYAAVTLPALTVATVGGGTGLGTARECLEILGCTGAERALKLAEITAATLLAGELSMGAALASGEFAAAHEQYGRNRPPFECNDVWDAVALNFNRSEHNELDPPQGTALGGAPR